MLFRSIDNSIHKWRYIQYRKRYEFLKQNYPQIADIAKTAVLNNAILHYAFNGRSLTRTDLRELYRYICSYEFHSGITSKHLSYARAVFRFLPQTVSFLIRVRLNSKTG